MTSTNGHQSSSVSNNGVSQTPSLLDLGMATELDRVSFDALYEFIVSSDQSKRQPVLAWLKRLFEHKFGDELAIDHEARHLFDKHLGRMLARDVSDQQRPVQRLHQVFLLFTSIVLHKEVSHMLCEPPVSNTATGDEARCDRLAFQHFRLFLTKAYASLEMAQRGENDLFTYHSVPAFTSACAARYASLLPPHSTLRATRKATSRKRPPDALVSLPKAKGNGKRQRATSSV